MNPQTIIEIVRDTIDQLLAASPEMFLFFALIASGYALKAVPFLPNNYIPAVNLVVAAVVYPLLCDPGKAPPELRYPVVRYVLTGLVIFVLSWVAHAKFLKALEEKWNLFGNGKDKPPTPPPTQ
jgi:hypothetical protein